MVLGLRESADKKVYYIASIESDKYHTSGHVCAEGGAECENYTRVDGTFSWVMHTILFLRPQLSAACEVWEFLNN